MTIEQDRMTVEDFIPANYEKGGTHEGKVPPVEIAEIVQRRATVNNRDKLIAVYREQLAVAVTEYPFKYAWSLSELETVMSLMIPAIDRMSFNKDSHAWKATCKALGIEHTYQAIKAFRDGAE
jgi:hypothetical protein